MEIEAGKKGRKNKSRREWKEAVGRVE